MSPSPQPSPQGRGSAFALGVLTLVNLLNYTDRYIVAGAMKEMQSKFSLDDTSGGLLATTFMVVGDHPPRMFSEAARNLFSRERVPAVILEPKVRGSTARSRVPAGS